MTRIFPAVFGFIFTAVFSITASADPIVDCQVAGGKASGGCIKKAAKASLNCFKKTGVACADSDPKVTAAISDAGAAINSGCIDDAAVAGSGYAPLTASELGQRLGAACDREVDTIAATVFGGPTGPNLVGADKADTGCMLTAAKEAGKLIAKRLKLVGKCVGKVCDLDKIDNAIDKSSTKATEKINKKCTDLASLIGADTAGLIAQAEEQVMTAVASPCDPMDETDCLMPATNDYFSVVDPLATSGRRLNYASEAMPKNNVDVSVDPTAWNRLDGHSVGPVLLYDDQSIDLDVSGATPITDIATSLGASAPVAIIKSATGERQLLWAERDSSGPNADERVLMVRVGANLENETRYIAAIGPMRDALDAPVTSNAIFAAYRDRTTTQQLPVEARRHHMEKIFDSLQSAGIARETLFLAWDFSTQSIESTNAYLLHMRNDTFDNILGDSAPAFTVTSVAEPSTVGEIFRQVDGTFEVPLYLTDGGAPKSDLRFGPDGLPVNEGDFFTANFRCLVPYAATTGGGAPAVPGRPSLYGHGLLGTFNETSASHVRAFSQEHNLIFCGTDWTGFANEDTATAVDVLRDFSNFPKFIGRQHQGVLNFMVLGRLLLAPDGFASDPAFQVGGQSVIDPAALYYDGNSQGGILGGVLAAFSQDIDCFSLGVPGINYSTLLRRSVDFDDFNTVFEFFYTNGVSRSVMIQLAQKIWDKTDPSGHVRHVTSDTYPNTPAKKILYQVAFGDHQVAPVTVEVAARSNGAHIHTPALVPGKVVPEVAPYYDIPAIPSYPFDGSAMIIWDSGNPAPPTGNQPPAEITDVDPEWTDLSTCAQNFGSDPHECPRRQVEARSQKSQFFASTCPIVDTCSGAACLAPNP